MKPLYKIQDSLYTLYHCGDEDLSEDKFDDVIWFSDKPLSYFGRCWRYTIEMENPLVIQCKGAGWDDKLWWYCCDENGTPNKDPNDKELLEFIPVPEIWQDIMESDIEYELGDIPYLVKWLYKRGTVPYDSVALLDIGETPNCSVIVNDYCIFSMNQIKQQHNE